MKNVINIYWFSLIFENIYTFNYLNMNMNKSICCILIKVSKCLNYKFYFGDK